MSDQRPKEPKFVPRPCAVCGEPNTVEHRCDYPPSNPLLDLAAIRALHDKASQHHEATDYYSLLLAIRKMLPEIDRLTRERDEWKEIADRSSVATSAWIGKHERLRALNEHLDYEVLRWEKESDVLRAALADAEANYHRWHQAFMALKYGPHAPGDAEALAAVEADSDST